MAEIVLSAMLPVLFEKLASAALKTFARYNGIDADIKKWHRSLTLIHGVLADASHKEISSPPVKRWLTDLQHLAYDIDDVLDGWLTEVLQSESTHESEDFTSKVKKLIIPTCCTSFSRSTTMLAQLDDISTKLQDLVKQKDTLSLLSVTEETRPRNIINNRRYESSVLDPYSIVGRQAEKDELVQQLLLPAKGPCDKNYNIVPIVGMGGVGKTTLAKLLCNEKQVADHFQLKAWVCVSDEFDIFARSKEIFQALGGEVKEEHKNFDKLQVALKDHLTGKRFLLVLDNVWSVSHEDWNKLSEPFYTCALGSKIIITTRNSGLIEKWGYNVPNKQLERLSDNDALSFLARHALDKDKFDPNSSLKPYAEGIVKNCAGLPLALIALSRLLRTKQGEVEHWKEVLNSEIWRLEDGGILPSLRLSYHDLSATLKQLFAYCSLFPKGFLFDKDDLVLLWMAEGFLNEQASSDSTEEHLGPKCFDELLSRSFFQHAPNNESLFVMHDLMNDLATHVASGFYSRLDNESEKNNRMGMLELYRHMSFVREHVPYTKFEAFERAKSLRTFLATSVGEVEIWHCLSSKVLTHLLSELSLLRVLSLSGFQISEVPESIGTLRHLRYLNLSRSVIYDLPENVCNLYNLQSLILFGCNILTKLPKNFLKLKNLRHLDVRGSALLFQELLRIGELKSLQIALSRIVIKSENGFEIVKLKDFKNLSEKISIVGLEKVQNASHVHEANFSQKRLSELKLVWSDELHDSRNEMLEKEVLNELKPCDDKLSRLEIWSYGGLEFPKWVGDPSFLNLKHVSISRCKKCTSLPSVAQLPSLKELFIQGLDAVEVVNFELFQAGSTFPSLEILSFEDMREWKKLSGAAFQRLQKLKISGCPNLVEVTLGALPLLNDLQLYKCDSGVLINLVEMSPPVTKLRIEDISGLNDVVWRGVIEYLGALEELEIYRCNEIRYLVKSDAVASKTLVKLRKLRVRNCDNLVSLEEKEVEEDNCKSNLLTSLRILEVFSCENMECCRCPDGIEELSVWICSSMTVVSFPKGGQAKLRKLVINNCRNLLEMGLGGQSMPKLEYVSIYEWPNLKSVIELNGLVHLTELNIFRCENLDSFPDNLTSLKKLKIGNCPNLKSIIELNGLVHLTELIIVDCENLESFPDNLTSLKKLSIYDCPKLDVSFLPDNFASLEELTIRNCPRMDAPFSFSGGVWPPNLRSLDIGKLKKPFSEWDPQQLNFPTSLVELELHGGGGEDGVSSCSQISHLLPSSLISLEIIGFEKLESFSIKLQHLQYLSFISCPNLKEVSSHPQHLTSLHHLYFNECPNMIELPELLLPSLLKLDIWRNCPKLKERYSKGGRYWHLISHIPCIDIWS